MSIRAARYVYIALIASVTLLGASEQASAAPKKAAKPKKPAAATPVPPRPTVRLRVVDRIESATADYQADAYSAVALTDAYAKERGLDHGLVWIAFTNEREFMYRVPKEKIRRVTRMIVEDDAVSLAFAPPRPALLPVTFTSATTTPSRPAPNDRVDVLDTTEASIVVITQTSNGGIFTSSEVYIFPNDARALEPAWIAKAPVARRDRLREALELARAHAAK